MTPLPPAAGVVKIDTVMQVGADPNAHCHLFWGYSGGSTTLAQLNALATAAQASWAANLKSLFESGLALTRVDVYDLANPAAQIGSSAGSAFGSRTGGVMTAETCTLINLKVARRYRGGHPRIYWPMGVAPDLNDPQTWTTSFQGQVTTNWTAHLAAIQGATGGPTLTNQVNVSYYSAHALRTTPLVEPIISWHVNPKPASQRRRMLR